MELCRGYEEIPLQEGLKLEAGSYMQCAHVMLYAEKTGALFQKYPFKYVIMVSPVYCWYY